jgi:hypothetical protein
MSRVALFGCTSVFLLSAVLQALAAPPAESKRRAAPVVKAAAKSPPVSRPVARVAAPVRPSSPPLKSAKATVKPQLKLPPPANAAAKPMKAVSRTSSLGGAAFDRSTRSNLLPAGAVRSVAPKSAPKAVQNPTMGGAIRKAAAPNTRIVKTVAGAAVGAAVIGAGMSALARPAAASPSAAPGAVASGPVRPAARMPLANLNHPHVKPAARMLPSLVGHKNANRPRLPLFVLAPAFLGASWMGREFYVWNRRSYDNVGWIAPIPSCYVGGTVFYRDPWSGECFNFDKAEPGERFAVGAKVYAWIPTKYPSVEDMVDDQERSGASVMTEPFRIANPTAPVRRIEATRVSAGGSAGVAAGPATVSMEATDCSSCLTAIGPVEVTGGQCSVTISNNCGLPVAFDVEFQRNDQTFCQTKSDAASASEVIVCTQPCTTFLESRVNLKSAIPKLATSAPFKGCRPHWAALDDQAR